MANFKFYLALIAAIAVISSVQSSILKSTPIKTLAGSEDLDTEGKYILSWEVKQDEKRIYFEVVAETTGYVGFGLSPNGAMTGADILIAGVNADKSVYSSDWHGVGNTRPVEDAHADWTVTKGEETATHTTLHFNRLLDTCDEEDFKITDATMHVIWSMGETDEVSYHGETRGTKSVNFYLNEDGGFDPAQFQNHTLLHTMTMKKEHTSYWCSIHEMPLFTKKQHIVGFEPVLATLPAIAHTHHFIIYRCVAPAGQDAETLFKPWVGHPGDYCYDQSVENFPFEQYCNGHLVYVWSKGGKRMLFPEDLGLPTPAQPGQREYWALEIHYDNPQEAEGLTFETGSRFYYTENLRPTDVGLMVVDHRTRAQLTIPPKVSDYVVSGHCSSECTQQFLPEEGITVFNVLLHAHLTARKIALRQFRGDEELPWVDRDDYYDFDFQQNKPLTQTRKFERGDQLTVECTFDTTGVKDGKAVIGGLSSKEEMCQAWFFYYPRQSFDSCGSSQDINEHMELLGVTNFNLTDSAYIGGQERYQIWEPENLKGDYLESLSTKVNWTPEFLEKFQEAKRYGVQQGICFNGEDRVNIEAIKYPDNLKEYVAPDECKGNGGGGGGGGETGSGMSVTASLASISVFAVVSVVVSKFC